MVEKFIPDIIVSRLPRYLQTLDWMLLNGMRTTSSQELGEIIGISAAQIRKDLSQFGEFGKQGRGYSIPFLVEQLESILKVNRNWNMVLVGAGNLGHAIANYQGFPAHGFYITQIFDNDPKCIGMAINGMIVQDTARMGDVICKNKIRIALLTVPASAAQSIVDELILGGIRAILNYAPTTLSVPDEIHVQYIDPINFLQRMTYYLD